MWTMLAAFTMLMVQTPQSPSVTHTIRGVVTSIGTPDAVPDAEVSVGIDKSDLDTVIAAFKYDQKFPMRTTSDGSGHFSFGGIVPGKFIVTVQHDGFFAKTPDAKGTMKDSDSVPVTVAANQDGSELSVPMLAGAVVAGRVYGVDGHAVPRVTVQAYSPYTEAGVQKLKPVASRDTNDDGVYRLFWLPPGEYVVGVSPDGPPQSPALVITEISSQVYLKTFYPNSADESTSTRVSVKSGDDVTSIDINLRPAPNDRRFPPPPPPPPPSPSPAQ